MYLVITRTPGESIRRRLRSLLLYLCHVFRALINTMFAYFFILFPDISRSSQRNWRNKKVSPVSVNLTDGQSQVLRQQKVQETDLELGEDQGPREHRTERA